MFDTEDYMAVVIKYLVVQDNNCSMQSHFMLQYTVRAAEVVSKKKFSRYHYLEFI